MSRTLILSLLLGLTATACDGEGEATKAAEPQRGSVAKADLVGSCVADDGVNACGGPSAAGSCWCDTECETYGDCCSDKASVCDGDGSLVFECVSSTGSRLSIDTSSLATDTWVRRVTSDGTPRERYGPDECVENEGDALLWCELDGFLGGYESIVALIPQGEGHVAKRASFWDIRDPLDLADVETYVCDGPEPTLEEPSPGIFFRRDFFSLGKLEGDQRSVVVERLVFHFEGNFDEPVTLDRLHHLHMRTISPSGMADKSIVSDVQDLDENGERVIVLSFEGAPFETLRIHPETGVVDVTTQTLDGAFTAALGEVVVSP